MSTNDTVYILANGAAGNPEITKRGRSFRTFLSHLKKVCRVMARALVKDGEGATRSCEIKIRGAKTDAQAERIARQIASSMLFKTMLAGGEANWGRVLAAVGATQIKLNLSKIDLAFQEVKILQQGKILKKNLPAVRKVLNRRELSLQINLGSGSGSAQRLTCDLTKDYVRLNSWYST
jgi:glutamate N-acetyltransferase/amino-acid N-acetyltransferase